MSLWVQLSFVGSDDLPSFAFICLSRLVFTVHSALVMLLYSSVIRFPNDLLNLHTTLIATNDSLMSICLTTCVFSIAVATLLAHSLMSSFTNFSPLFFLQ
jgi:hypothetical protein